MAEGEPDDIPRQLSIPTSSQSSSSLLTTTIKEEQPAAVDGGDFVRAVLKYTNDDGR